MAQADVSGGDNAERHLVLHKDVSPQTRSLLLEQKPSLEDSVLAKRSTDGSQPSDKSEVAPGSSDTCQNTVQGRDLIADDRGYVCARRELNMSSGCCGPSHREQFACRACNASTQCCELYESCVSCCQDPSHAPSAAALAAPRANQPGAAPFSSVFDYCRGRCRHNSLSVVHENAYRSKFHHCYRAPELGGAGQKAGAEEEEEETLEGVTVLVGAPGQSCQATCTAANLQRGVAGVRASKQQRAGSFLELTRGGTPGCVAGEMAVQIGPAAGPCVSEEISMCKWEKLALLNKCPELQKHFACKGACIASMGPDQPAEVVATAPRHQMPGACLYNTKAEYFSCGGSHASTRRLCPCL
eukprot:jgi/Mesen1/5616/ME000282S04778